MRFLRKVGQGGDEFKNGLSFLVKSIDRPTVTPTVEELNQYNKKRMIHTGIKYSPVTCVLYDTADSSAMSMLVQYAQYYFGDFRQDSSSYADDIVSAKMFGTTGGAVSTDGFGFGITKNSSASVDGSNTQFFFDRIDVFQVWGGEYTCFQLLNPRISSYDPDELDYENSGASTITLTINYEAINHENGGKPQRITSNAALTELFGGDFDGETFDPQPSATRTTSFTSTTPTPSIPITPNTIQDLLNQDTGVTYSESDRSDTTTSAGGALSKYGNFDFGDFTSLGSTLPTELSTLAGSNPSPDVGGLNDPFPAWVKTTKQANELELARIQQAQRRANQDALGSALGSNISKVGDIAAGVSAASLLQGNTPNDQVRYDDSFMAGMQDDSDFGIRYAFPAPLLDDEDVIPAPASNDATVSAGKVKAKGGLSLSPLAIAAVNTSSDGRSQIGQRKNASDNPLLAFIVEPKPSSVLTPELVFGRAHNLAIKLGVVASGMRHPRPVAGPINKQITPRILALGYVTQSGSINASIPIKAVIPVFNSLSGSVKNASWQFNLFMTAIAPVIGSSNPTNQGVSRPITIRVQSNMRSQATVSGYIDRSRVRIFGDAAGEIKNRAATLYKALPIKPNITGIVQVTGSINKSIVIKQDSVIIFPVTGPLEKEIKITASSRGTHIPMRTATIGKQIVIKTSETTGIIKQPVIGTINKPITPAFIMLATHKQPVKGTIAKPLLITSLSYARVPFFATMTNKRIVIGATIRGNVDAFGTLNRQVRITATATGSSLVFGTMSRQIVVGRSISGHSTTNVSPAHRYWRMRIASNDQSVVGPNEIQFRDNAGNPVAGTVTASSSYNATYAPGKAFDRDGSTWWSTAIGQATGAWIAIDLGANGDKEVRDVLLATDDLARVPTRYELQFSDDSVYWNTKAIGVISAPENNSIYVTRQVTLEPLTSETVKYRGMYRFRTVTNAGDTVRIANMVLYNPTNQPIPAMSPFASSTSVGAPANAFDSDVNSVWVSSVAEASSATVGFYAATLDTQIGSITLRADPSTGGGATMPTSFVVEYSNNDGASWTVVFEQNDLPPFSDGETRNITVGINGAVNVGDGSALQVNDDQDVLGY